MAKTFNVLGTDIQFSEQMDNYNALRLKFKKLAEDYSDDFVKLYKQQNSNLDDVSKNAFQQGFQFIYKAVEVALDELVTKYKIYTLDEDTFFNDYYCDYFSWEEQFNTINEQYLEIVLDSTQLDEYREARRQSRGRVVGGGFGVGGALKGMATAGAMNMATGAAHMMFNGMAKTLTAIGNSSKKSKIFKNPETLETLENGVYINIFNMHIAIVNAVEALKSDEIFDYVTKNESKEAELIFSNLSKGRIPKEEIGSLLIDIFTRNPYPSKYYTYTLEKYGDENGGLSKMANYFGIHLDYYKEELIEKQLVEPTSLKSVQEIDQFLIKIDNLATSIGLTKLDSLIAPYKVQREKLDLLERTVDDHVFSTTEEANIAKQELQRMQSLYDMNKVISEKQAIETLQTIEKQHWETIIPTKYVEALKEVIAKYDLIARTIDGTEYATREEAQLIREAQIEIDNLKKNANLTTLEGIDKAIEQATLSSLDEKVQKPYIAYLTTQKAELDKKLRTFKGTVYETMELAQQAAEHYAKKAADEVASIQAIVSTNNSKKEIKNQLINLSSEQFETTEALEELEKAKTTYLKSKPATASKQQDVAEVQPKAKKSWGKRILLAFVVITIFTLAIAMIGSNSNEAQEEDLTNTAAEQPTPEEEMPAPQEETVVSPIENPVTAVSEVIEEPVVSNTLDSIPFIGASNTVESARDQISYLIHYYLEAYVYNDIDLMQYYIYPQADFYATQTQYMTSLYERGISMDLVDYRIVDMKQVSDESFVVTVDENYAIYKPTTDTNYVSQISTYSVELINGEFYIITLDI